MIDLSFSFSAACWRWQSTATAWYFITLPEEQSEEIKFFSENVHGQKARLGCGARAGDDWRNRLANLDIPAFAKQGLYFAS